MIEKYDTYVKGDTWHSGWHASIHQHPTTTILKITSPSCAIFRGYVRMGPWNKTCSTQPPNPREVSQEGHSRMWPRELLNIEKPMRTGHAFAWFLEAAKTMEELSPKPFQEQRASLTQSSLEWATRRTHLGEQCEVAFLSGSSNSWRARWEWW